MHCENRYYLAEQGSEGLIALYSSKVIVQHQAVAISETGIVTLDTPLYIHERKITNSDTIPYTLEK